MLSRLREVLDDRFRRIRDGLDGLRRVKSRSDRIDSLTSLVGGVLMDSGLRYLDGDLVFFDSRCYVPLSERDLMTSVRSVLMGLGVSPTDLRTMGSMPVDLLCARTGPSDRSLVCFSNCVYRVGSDEMLGFSPDLAVRESLPYPLRPGAPCPRWKAFMEWAVPEEGERMALQEFAGLAYVDRDEVSVEKFAVLIGSGANGKSVFIRVISAAMGEGNVSTLDPQQLTSEKMVPYLRGKRMNCSPDVRASAAFDSALKALSSGQAVTGRRIYGDAEQVQCPPILFALNEMPSFRDTSEGFYRRLLIFRFVRTVAPGDQDRQLASRIIREELPGVMDWMLEGRRRLLAQGGEFTSSESMEQALREVRNGPAPRESRSPLRDWLDDNGYALSPSGNPVRVSANTIFDGLHGLMSKSAVTRELERLGAECRRCGDGMHYCLYEKT